MTPAIKFFRYVFIFLIVSVAAHSQVVGGSIGGVVHDSTGANLFGASVTVRQNETGATRTLTTDQDGRFFAPSVPVGSYTVTVNHDGFSQERQTGISLAIGQSLQLNFVLGIASVQQAVEVDASGSLP